MKTKPCPKCNAEIGRTCRICPECNQPCTKPPYVPKKVRGFKEEARKKKNGAKVKTVKELANKHCPLTVTQASHVRTTLLALGSILDLTDAEPMLQHAYNSHVEAVDLLLQ